MKKTNQIIKFIRQKPLLSALIFAGILVVIGVWMWQKNSYSKDILKLEILGPSEVELAQEVTYTVKYKNNGEIKLEEAKLAFEAPEYSILDNSSTTKKEIILDDIYPGQEKTFSFKARLLGKEGDVKEAKAWLSYRPKNLKARYESETSHSAQLKLVPLTLEFDLPSRIDSGKEMSFKLNYFSNVNYPLGNLGVKVEYPTDFEFKASKPKTLEKTEWNIGLLNRAEGGRIEVSGTLGGTVGEQKQFKTQLGTWQNGVFVVLKEAIRGVQIVTPSLYISQLVNGNAQYTANAGDSLHYEIFFKNIANDAFNELFLVVKLDGEMFDFSTLKAPQGSFESGDNSIVFDWRDVPKLQFLGAQEEGRVEFWVDLKKSWEIVSVGDKNPVLKDNVILGQAQKEFAVNVNSRLEIVQKGYYQDEVFGNSGYIPPAFGQQTTYTIIWQIKNHYSDVKNISARAVLGQNVSLTGLIFPEDARLTFDSNSREVVWQIGDLEAGYGVLVPASSVAFQIVFTPSLSQKGTVPNLIGQVTITGEDQATSLSVQGISPAINTTLPDDDSVSSLQGIVQ
jgi:hypothetical protein